MLVRAHAGEGINVLSSLFADDIDYVIYCDDAEELVFGVDDGDTQEVVIRDQTSDVTLLSVGADADQLRLHDLLERCCRRNKKQLSQTDHTNQMIPIVNHVEIEDHLNVTACTLDCRYRF